ncbi:MAG: anti-sigma factor family protein [Chloroflexota bacterium]
MDHAEARELLELAAIEPGGLDRLAAGDTSEAAALAGHLAGCPACAEELERLRDVSDLIRAALREDVPATVPADLRARTLASVAELGRERGREAAPAAPAVPAASAVPVVSGQAAVRRRARPVRWWASLAAALVIGAGLGGFAVGTGDRAALEAQEAAITALARVNEWAVRVARQPDMRTVTLTDPSGGAAAGTLVFSPATDELVVVMTGIAPPPAGREYRCWVESNGVRRSVGRMFFAGEYGSWAGRVSGLAGLGPGTVFGVSLVDPANPSTGGEPILRGSL